MATTAPTTITAATTITTIPHNAQQQQQQQQRRPRPRRRPLTWLVTGCSSGVGLALARAALARGDRVVATSRDPGRTPELVAEVEGHYHGQGGGDGGEAQGGGTDSISGSRGRGRGKWMALDVCWGQERICEVVREAEGWWASSSAASFASNGEGGGGGGGDGGIDVVVNNAAYSVLGAVEDVDEETAKRQFETNVWGAVRVCKAVMPGMRDGGQQGEGRGRGRGGIIVNISSALGLTTWPGVGMYSASKFALEAISQTLSVEAAPFGIRVLIVNLGSFRTNFLGGTATQITEPSKAYQRKLQTGGGDEDDEHPVVKALNEERKKNGTQPGDPVKAAREIYDEVVGIAARMEEEASGGSNSEWNQMYEDKGREVLRLPLGSDAWQAGIGQADLVRRDFEARKDVAHKVQVKEE